MKTLVLALSGALATVLFALPALADGGNIPTGVAVIGRGHMLLLHFPIALLVAALVIELVLRKRVANEKRTISAEASAAHPVTGLLLLLAAIGSVLATATGLLHAADEEWHGSTEALMVQHRAGGIVTALLAVAVFFAQRKLALKSAFLPLLIVANIAVGFTGHRGGQLVHGEGYLLAPLGNDAADEGPDRIVASDGDENAEETRLRHPEGAVPETPSYLKDIKPIIDRSCLKCHGPEKRKSGLRLDKKRFALKGGETGPAIVPGDPATSLFYKYITLPSDDEDVMPSKGKLLALSEIETIKKWIAAGAEWPDD